MNRTLKAVLLALTLGAGTPGMANHQIPDGYRSAVAGHGVSAALFYAMALTESGQSEMTAGYRPWPWTLSVNREALFFPDRRSAEAALRAAVKRRAEQLGVGLFQIEYRYHGQRFESLEAMLDPYFNSRIAAEIFSEGLHRANGDVWTAVGFFHSGTPKLADAYRKRVAQRLINLIGNHGQ